VRAVRLVQALLPPDEAGRMLDAIGNAATQAEVLSEVAHSKQQLAVSDAVAPRPVATGIAPVRPPPMPVVAPPPPPPSGPQPVPALAPPATPGLPLTIYYHVQRADDRELASAVAGAVAPRQFRSAGIQVIPQGPSSAQVRYYKPAQKAAAQALADLLSQQLETLTGKAVPFRPVDISATFPNLPSDRMEVWFAPSMPALKPS